MTTSKVMGRADVAKAVAAVEKTLPMSKELELKLRERATQVQDRVAEMMRSMFASLDAEREVSEACSNELTATARKLDAALAVVNNVVPDCGWADCKRKSTRSEVGNVSPTGRLCDGHTHGTPVEDNGWAEELRALTALLAEEEATGAKTGEKETVEKEPKTSTAKG